MGPSCQNGLVIPLYPSMSPKNKFQLIVKVIKDFSQHSIVFYLSYVSFLISVLINFFTLHAISYLLIQKVLFYLWYTIFFILWILDLAKCVQCQIIVNSLLCALNVGFSIFWLKRVSVFLYTNIVILMILYCITLDNLNGSNGKQVRASFINYLFPKF